MKNLFNIILSLIIGGVIVSCVDSFQDANPPRLKDGPYFLVTLSSESIKGGNDFTFTINVVDVPGGIDSVAIVNTKGGGSYKLNNFNEIKGKTEGTITGTYTAPTTFNGKLDLDFMLFDAQLDSKGKKASKSATVTKSINVTFPSKLTTFTVDFPTTSFIRGSSIDFEINVDSAASGVDTVYIIANRGLAVINQADYNNILGKESGKLRVTYNSDVEYVGEVTLTVYVVDRLQKRVSSKATKLAANYEFAAPTVNLKIDALQFKAYTEIDLDVTIDAPGTIKAVKIESFEVVKNVNGDKLGNVSLKADEVTDAIGKKSAKVHGSFSTTIKGFYNIIVTVTDDQGRVTTSNVEVLVFPCDKANIAGKYNVLTSGESSENPAGPYTNLAATVQITGAIGNNFTINDLSFGLYTSQGYSGESGKIVTCDMDIISGSSSSIKVISGKINPDKTIEIEWESKWGDSGYSVLTPAP
jgi:hypothetical protein